MSNRFLEGIRFVWFLEGVWKVSGGCQEGVRKVFGKNPDLISTGRKGLICLEGVWKVSESYLRGVWKVSGGFWKVSGR